MRFLKKKNNPKQKPKTKPSPPTKKTPKPKNQPSKKHESKNSTQQEGITHSSNISADSPGAKTYCFFKAMTAPTFLSQDLLKLCCWQVLLHYF